jgi:superfamily II DNA or RNA helicase
MIGKEKIMRDIQLNPIKYLKSKNNSDRKIAEKIIRGFGNSIFLYQDYIKSLYDGADPSEMGIINDLTGKILFEELVYAIFKICPSENKIRGIIDIHKPPFKEEISKRFNIPTEDVSALDLIIECKSTNSVNEYFGVQIKSTIAEYLPHSKSLQRFLSVLPEDSYIKENKKKKRDLNFNGGILITLAESVPSEFLGHSNMEVINIHQLQDIFDKFKDQTGNNFFDSFVDFIKNSTDYKLNILKRIPKHYQSDIVKEFNKLMLSILRFQIILPPGDGKTFVDYLLMSNMNSINPGKFYIFITSQINLANQAISDFIDYSLGDSGNIEFIPCFAFSKREDEIIDEIYDTYGTKSMVNKVKDAEGLENFYFFNKRSNFPKIIFTTYQSSKIIAESIKKLDPNFEFAIKFLDEADLLVGDMSDPFAMTLNNEYLPSKYTITQTGTLMDVDPKTKAKGKKLGKTFAGFESKKHFGHPLKIRTLKESIEDPNGNLVDYQLAFHLSGNDPKKNLSDIFSEREFKSIYNDWFPDGEASPKMQRIAVYESIALRSLFYEIISGENKIVTFHNTIASARRFSRLIKEFLVPLWDEYFQKQGICKTNFIDYIEGNGSQHSKISKFKRNVFDISILCNVRCIGRGFNDPSLGTVILVEPRQSFREIVQNLGRPLRKDPNNPNKIAKFIVASIIDDYEK